MMFSGLVLSSIMLLNGTIIEVKIRMVHTAPLVACAGVLHKHSQSPAYFDLICKEESGKMVERRVQGTLKI